jgi:ribosomal protein S18 acetylase RimI-like enzyme
MGASFVEPPSGRPSIRAARVEDAAVTAAIRVRGWQAAYRRQLPDELLDTLSMDRDTIRFADHIGHLPADRRVWVAELEGDVVGFASTGPSRDPDTDGTGEVYAIYVRPDRYSRGIGTMLLDHAVADLASRGYREAVLWTLETNTSAQRFYERAGWRPDGAEKADRMDEFELREVRYRLSLDRPQVEPA